MNLVPVPPPPRCRTDTPSLTATLHAWLKNPAEAAALAQRAQSLIAVQRGSTQKYVEKILSLLPPLTPPQNLS